MSLEVRRYRQALRLALRVAHRAATLDECRARLTTCLNLIDKLGGTMPGRELLPEVERRLKITSPTRPPNKAASGGGR